MGGLCPAQETAIVPVPQLQNTEGWWVGSGGVGEKFLLNSSATFVTKRRFDEFRDQERVTGGGGGNHKEVTHVSMAIGPTGVETDEDRRWMMMNERTKYFGFTKSTSEDQRDIWTSTANTDVDSSRRNVEEIHLWYTSDSCSRKLTDGHPADADVLLRAGTTGNLGGLGQGTRLRRRRDRRRVS